MKRGSPLKRTAFKAKEGRKLVRKAMSRTPKGSKSKAMKEADKWFSMFIRLRDADENGMVKCITCGKLKHWKEVDCGHYVTRAKQVLRYDERNCNAQCKGCNQWQGGHFVEHGFAIDRKHGEGTYRKLLERAYFLCKRTLSDFRFIADTYRLRVENIKANSPGKFRQAA